jgi:hypothetical protein
MTTPDSFGSGGATGTGAGGLAAGPGDDAGEAAVNREAETGSPGRPETPETRTTTSRQSENSAESPGTEGGLGTAGEQGPDLTEDDETSASS